MRICSAQFESKRGDIKANIEAHKKFIKEAVQYQAEAIIFPELSLTSYEPALAEDLAVSQDDGRLDVFQRFADRFRITIGVGLPTVAAPRPAISMIIFQPGKRRERYSKKYIHADEEPFFIGEQNSSIHLGQYHNIALAICYEISNDEHVLAAYESGSGFYFASVAKFVDGIDKAHERLAEIARTYSMTVMLSNCVGTADGAVCGGRSAVWNKQGALLGQLDDINQGLLIFDTVTQECRAYPVR